MKRLAIFAYLVIAGYFLSSCQSGAKKQVSNAVGFAQYISAYTSGVIGVNEKIRVDLTSAVGELIPEQLNARLFQFDPSASGKIAIYSGHSLIFMPDKPLHSGQSYQVTFNLGLLVNVPDSLKQFKFLVRTVAADYSVASVGIRSFRTNGELKTEISGLLIASDAFPQEEIEKMVRAEQDGAVLPVQWAHVGDQNTWQFVFSDVKRTREPEMVHLTWSGSPIGADKTGEQDVEIPATGDFRLLKTEAVPGTSPYIVLTFSDPLDPDQDTQGLFTMQGIDFEVTLEDNRVKLVPVQDVVGEQKLHIFQSLKNYKGESLGLTEEVAVSLEPQKPTIRFVGKGNIVPGSDGLVVPFEAVNLGAVAVRIVKIFSNNYHQFFQNNDLNQDNSLKRVGRPVYRGVFSLSGIHAVIPNKWSAYSLKISDLVKIEPGAIYQVQFSMRPEFSLYPCSGDADVKNVKRKDVDKDDNRWLTDRYIDEDERWDEYEGNYNWNQRENPCYISYFIEHGSASKNVIASNLGLLAKRGVDNQLLVVATNLLTAQPQPGTEITVYDYQAQVITSGKTGENGMVTIPLDRTPFLVVARNGNDVGYLKISDEASLQLSRFDVGGEVVQKGLKGFLYGERGVWRPGDSLFVSLIIQDKVEKLAPNHPVIFELYSPSDQLEQKIVMPLNENICTLRTVTKPDAPTGNWRLVAKIGGVEFSKRIRIETVKPNRLKLQFTTSAGQLQAEKEDQTATLNAKWLHGGNPGALKAKVEMQLKKGKTTFPKFLNYSFDNEIAKFESTDQTIFDGKLNENGDVTFPLNPGKLTSAPGKLEAVFTIRVFEPGGDFSISQFNRPVSPFPKYVGMRFPDIDPARKMLSTGQNNNLDLVVVNPEGNPVEASVEVLVYKLEWRWWWDASDNYLGNYVNQERYQPYLKQKLTTSGGKATLKFNMPNKDWGRYLFIAKLPDGHSVSQTVYIDWPYGGASAQAGGATMLTFATDKEKYQVGDDISVSFPSSKEGKALVSIENGSTILDKFWVDTNAGQTKISFKAKPEMAPNVFLYITYLQPHGQTVNDKPIRLYGVIPVFVEDAATHLNPVINVPDELRSQKPFTVEVSEKRGAAMNYTLAIVDEGLLDITGFRTPDPWSAFFAREALGVKTWDLYDYVLGAFGGTLEKLFAVGGSDQLPDPSKQRAQRFKPVVRFYGPFSLGKNEKQKHTITLPQYTGSVRVMVVGASDNAFGSSDKAVPVRDPLMILPTIPRTIGINETIELPVTVFVQDAKIKNVEVTVSANEMLSVKGSNKQSVSFAAVGEKDVRFRLASGTKTGKATLVVTATSGGEKAVYNLEVDVRNPNPLIVSSQNGMVKPAQSSSFALQAIGAPGTGSTTVEVSFAPPMNIGKRLEYLVDYPHGCIEQTVSAAFAQLYVSRFVSLDQKKKEEIDRNIKAGIDQLRKFQLPDGSFAYWPGMQYPSLWGTSWAGNFMIEAELQGYVVPGDLKKRWLDYQKKAANAWRKELSDRGMVLDQAYRLYTLALANAPAAGAMNRLRETQDLPLEARWKLAAAYVLISRPEVADMLVDMTKLEPEKYQNPGITFGSTLRDRAILLETLTLMNKKSFAFGVAKSISEELCSDEWMSTQTTANCLVAMSKFIGKDVRQGEKLKFRITASGKAEEVESAMKTVTRDLPALDGKSLLKIDNLSGADLFITIVQKGIPLDVNIPARQNGLKLDLVYLSTDGKPVNVENIKKGTDFTAVVRVKNTTFGEVHNLALTQVFPSGWEIINERLFGGDTGSEYTYRDIRDDRVLTYFDLKMNEEKHFKVKLNATYSGTYFLPPVQCEAMYNHAVTANNSGMKVVVGE